MPGTLLPEAVKVAERLRKGIENATLDFSCEYSMYLSASFGVASLDLDSSDDFEQMIHKADQALYQAKNAGRNQVKVYSEFSTFS